MKKSSSKISFKTIGLDVQIACYQALAQCIDEMITNGTKEGEHLQIQNKQIMEKSFRIFGLKYNDRLEFFELHPLFGSSSFNDIQEAELYLEGQMLLGQTENHEYTILPVYETKED